MRRIVSTLFLALFLPLPAHAGTVEVLREAGPSANRIDLLIVGDGYTEAEQQKLSKDAERLVEGLFTFEPWRSFSGLFNVRLLKVVSNESGADAGALGGDRDTAFGAHFGCGGIDRLLCVNNLSVFRVAALHAPETDYIFAIVNDEKYGGSGGPVAVVSLHPLAIEILAHEVAHQIAGLADEYEDDYPGYPECSAAVDCRERNVTLRSTLGELKWASWVEDGMPLPSPKGASGVGLFEGARYRSQGVYRPENLCLMHSPVRREFCKVCDESHVLAFLENVDLIEDVSPVEVPAFSSCEEELVFAVQTIEGLAGMEIVWSLGGEVIARDVPELRLLRGALPEGENELGLKVEFLTDRVRNDDDGVLIETHTFLVEGGSCRGPCDGPLRCDGGVCTLEKLEDGTACGESACVLGVAVGLSCQAGQCVEQESGCGPYLCDEAGATCRTTCHAGSDCLDGMTCVDGACGAPLPQPKPRKAGGCSASNGGVSALGLALVIGAIRHRATGMKART